MPEEFLTALPRGNKLNQYEIIRVLGAGGFGVTYLARDTSLDKLVAIKEYMPSDFAVRGDGARVTAKSTSSTNDYQWGLARFLEEARILAKFRHPNIVEIHQIFEANETAYIVMEYAEGETLAQHLERVGTLNEAGISVVLGPILDGLQKVHDLGFLHRDIKPGNIILRAFSGPVLLDFGAARQAIVAKSKSITSVVTEGYAPIEQYASTGHQGAWTDIYALGAVAYRCLSGETPPAATLRIRDDPMKPIAAIAAGRAEPQFLAAIDWALSPNEADRPQSIAEWTAALQGAVDAEKTMRARRVDATMRSAEASHALTRVPQAASVFAQPVSQAVAQPVSGIPAGPVATGLMNRPLASLWPMIGGAAVVVLLLAVAIWWFVAGRIPEEDSSQWRQAVAANTVDAYKTYLQVMPAGYYASEAQDRIAQATSAADDADWAKAAAQNSSAGYQAYMDQYPAGRHLIQAKTAEIAAEHTEQIAHVQDGLAMAGLYKGKADGTETEATNAAIRNYQQSKNMPVTGRIDAALLAALDQDNAERLKARREAAQRETDAYDHAIALHDRATYEAFLHAFADSPHNADVRQRLAQCHVTVHMENVLDLHDITAKGTGRGTGNEGCRLAQEQATQQLSAQCQGRLMGVRVLDENHDTSGSEAGSTILSSVIGFVTKRNVNVNLPSTCTTDLRAHCAMTRAVQKQGEVCG
ncbi:MAG: serine/threonine-protein kinase [Rhizomicrobium sp.]